MLTVYTTVFGNTDPLHEPECRTEARLVCFTDQPIESDCWEVIRLPKTTTPTRDNRRMKALPHTLFDTEWTLYLDASFTLLVDPMELVHRAGSYWTNFYHAWRTRITQEADEIIRLKLAPADRVRAQIAEYQAMGFDTDERPMKGLSGNGALLRRNMQPVRRLCEMWWGQISKHTLRDQLSFDYCAWRMLVDRDIERWPGTHLDNPYFRFTKYKRSVNDV